MAVLCRRRKYRIRCNSLHPDGILTPMTTAGLRIIDDTYNANPTSMCAAVDILAAFSGRVEEINEKDVLVGNRHQPVQPVGVGANPTVCAPAQRRVCG